MRTAFTCPLVGTVLITLSLLAFPAHAALDAHMTVVGEQQGGIAGDVTLAGREGTFEISEFHHLSNASSHGAQHQPLIVMTRMSKGVPALLRALDQKESLSVIIRFYTIGSAGSQVNHYTITLQNARLVIAEPIMPDNLRSDLANLPARFRLRFEFDVITHTYESDGEVVEL